MKFDHDFIREWRQNNGKKPISDEVIAAHGGIKKMEVVGKIGDTGKHAHKLHLEYIKTNNGIVPLYVSSWCGSQRWSRGGHSGLMPLEIDDLSKVDCDKCLGRRVKGGKAPPPLSTRPKIDPDSRPKKYNFVYFIDYKSSGGHNGNKGIRHDEDVNAMNFAEAKIKLAKRIDKSSKDWGYEKVYGIELTSVWAWNHAPIWRKSLGTPYSGK